MKAGRLIAVNLVAVLLSMNLMSQQFGGNPPSLKWNQVNTDTVRVIFPRGLENKAMDIATLVQKLGATTQQTIGPSLKKVNIVLQNQTTVSNGYVSLGPYRSEFFLTPNQNSFELGSLPWHKTLALHEYRHVQQFNNFRKGISKAFYILFGEEGQALANSIAIPDWFWEGDAVYQETMLSNQGRGRIPYFFNPYRSIWTSEKNYSWMKLRNGSYRDMIPDHYHLGYLLVAYGREKYGDGMWRKVTDDAARFKGLFYPFQQAVKRNTGKSYREFRRDAIDYFKKFSPTDSPDVASAYGSNHAHFAGDYEFPQWADSGHLLYVKSSYREIPAFYSLDILTGKEKKIRAKDISSDTYFSYRNNRLVYAALQPDPRWGWRNYGIIKLVDTRTGEQRRVTKKTKYFSPDISADGKTIVAVDAEPSGSNALHFLESATGRLLSVMPNKEHLIFSYPKFYSATKVVSAVRNEKGEMALGLFDIASGNAQWLTAFSPEPIGFPQVNNDTISFSRSDGSQDKMFAVAGGQLYRFEPSAPNTTTSDYQLTIFEGKYSWTSFTAAGYALRNGTGKFIPVREPASNRPNTVYPLQRVENKLNFIGSPLAHHYPVEKYRASSKLFNFHSWRPYINDPEYSYSLVSENILNTFLSEVYLTYNRNEDYKQAGASLAYAGWFPVIQGGASYTFDRNFRDATQEITWNEFNATAGVKLPLSFNSGSFSQSIIPAATYNNKQVFYTGASKNSYANKQFSYGEMSLSATNQQLKALQNIYPRFAQTVYTQYRSILSKYSAYQLLVSGSLYFPGLSRNHSFVLQSALQQRDTLQEYNFSNGFPVSRGYSNLDYPRMWKFGVNYHFPIVYPDAGFANIIYLLRVRGNIYYDHTTVKSLRTKKELMFRSAGVEVYFDTKWWNQLPLSFGIRYSRLLDNDPQGRMPNQWEFVLPINLLSK